ncbi:MAG: hypothetical protein BA871_16460 [Desulfuromonadales bacterium C00003096]|nr:MAG: hypothetical protein BA871_16460 [Desulfuromonadales bacterium C00003096]
MKCTSVHVEEDKASCKPYSQCKGKMGKPCVKMKPPPEDEGSIAKLTPAFSDPGSGFKKFSVYHVLSNQEYVFENSNNKPNRLISA